MVKLYFDGACVPKNPGGDMGLGFWIEQYGKETYSFSKYIPSKDFPSKTSNNIAEYMALKEGLEYCISQNFKDIMVFGDSNLVIQQMSGKWKIKEGLYVPFALETQSLLSKYSNIKFQWIKREQNTRADELSNQDIPKELIEQAKINFSKYKKKS